MPFSVAEAVIIVWRAAARTDRSDSLSCVGHRLGLLNDGMILSLAIHDQSRRNGR
jgi:hypothetical protein